MTVLLNPERLTFMVRGDGATVIEPPLLAILLDGFELSSGVAFGGVERTN